jgi:hypothetical protein
MTSRSGRGRERGRERAAGRPSPRQQLKGGAGDVRDHRRDARRFHPHDRGQVQPRTGRGRRANGRCSHGPTSPGPKARGSASVRLATVRRLPGEQSGQSPAVPGSGRVTTDCGAPGRRPLVLPIRPVYRGISPVSRYVSSFQHPGCGRDCHRGFGSATAARSVLGLAGGEVGGRHLTSRRAAHGHLCREPQSPLVKLVHQGSDPTRPHQTSGDPTGRQALLKASKRHGDGRRCSGHGPARSGGVGLP